MKQSRVFVSCRSSGLLRCAPNDFVRKSFSRFLKCTDGFGLIETAVVFPIFLMVLFAIIDFSRMYSARYQSQTLTSTLSDIARAHQGETPEQVTAALKALLFKGESLGCAEAVAFPAFPTPQEITTVCGPTPRPDGWSALSTRGSWAVVAIRLDVSYLTPLPKMLGWGSGSKALTARAVVFGAL
jgi:hypothetical protein